MRTRTPQRWFVAAGAAVVLSIVGGYSMTQVAQGAPRTGAPSVDPTHPSGPYQIVAPTKTLEWSDASATLVPLDPAIPELHSAAAAFEAIRHGWVNVAADAGDAASPKAALCSYSNSAYGEVAPDGSVTLSYQNVPVWAFTIPLAHPLRGISQGGIGYRDSANSYTNCTFYYLVRATDNWYITSGEECALIDQPSPTPPPPGK